MLYFRTVNNKWLAIYWNVCLALWTLWILIYEDLKKSYLNYTRILQKHITVSYYFVIGCIHHNTS